MSLPVRWRSAGHARPWLLAAAAVVVAVCVAIGVSVSVSTGSHTFNVLDYGARADGVTDDAGAIQAAIDAASDDHGNVMIPAGVFLVGSTLELESGITIEGIRGQTVLAMPAQSSQTFIMQGTNLQKVTLSGLSFRSDDHGSDVSGVYMVGARDCKASFLRFDNLSYGMKLGSGQVGDHWTVSDVVARNCQTVLYISHVHDSTFARLDLQAVRLPDNQHHTVYLERECRGLSFSDCSLSGGSGYTLHLWVEGGSSSDLTFTNVSLDARTGGSPLVIGSGWSDIVFEDGAFLADSRGVVIQFYGGASITFDRFRASGGDALVGWGYVQPVDVVFRNGVYEGEELGTGVAFDNVVLATPGGTSSTTTSQSVGYLPGKLRALPSGFGAGGLAAAKLGE